VSITPTEGVATATTAPAGLAPATGTAATDDKQMFLELMVAQLRYQDPLNPTDSADFLAQSAQFTALEKMQEVADQTAAMVSAQLAFGASGLVGREIRYFTEDGTELTGTVTSVSFGAQGPTLDVAGTTISLGQVVSVVGSVAGGTTPGAGSATDPTSSDQTTDPGTQP